MRRGHCKKGFCDIAINYFQKGINERTIFYGDEEIVSKKLHWKLFALIKDISPSFASFYNFPHEKLIGVSRRVEI